ncbi:MAG: hypothetical protein K2H13_09070 [Eubacterium sp.]|nr:hypothetical protein [Eubacterium sp.]
MTDYSLVENELVHILHCDAEKLGEYESYINNAVACISSHLKDIKNENDSRVVRLCAAKAYYQIVLSNNEDDITSFKAGDVSYTRSLSSVTRAMAILDAAKSDCSALIKSSSFSFVAV